MFRTSRPVRYIIQNRRRIILIIGIILGIILVIQVLNSFAKKQLESKLNNNITINTTVNQNTYNPNETVLTNTTIEEKQAEKNTQIIENFVQYCNNGETQKAYELLSQECKEEVYPTLKKFENNYCKSIFEAQKEYNIQSWMATSEFYTYKIRFLDNILATGKYNSEAKEDYITIVEKDNEIKLNINSYIGRQEVNKKQESNGIIINALYRDLYMEYEKYTVKAENRTDKELLLDDLKTVKGIRLFGENSVEYQAYTNELSSYDVIVHRNSAKTLKVKFSKAYNPYRKDNKMAFYNMFLKEISEDDDENTEENNSEENVKIEINL